MLLNNGKKMSNCISNNMDEFPKHEEWTKSGTRVPNLISFIWDSNKDKNYLYLYITEEWLPIGRGNWLKESQENFRNNKNVLYHNWHAGYIGHIFVKTLNKMLKFCAFNYINFTFNWKIDRNIAAMFILLVMIKN